MVLSEVSRREVNWEEYDEMVQSIISQLGKWKPDAVIGLTRGGLIPAVNLSHYYDCKLYTLNISLRDGKAPKSKFKWQDVYKYNNLLIVDDINDSGRTLREVHNQFYLRDMKNPKFATLLSKPSSQMKVNVCGETINKDREDDWIVFPWE